MTKRVTKGYVVSHKYNGADTKDNPYIYPRLESEEDIFNFINRVVYTASSKSATAQKIIELFTTKMLINHTRFDINEALGLEARKPQVTVNELKEEGKRTPCPYGQVHFALRKLVAVGLLTSELAGRDAKYSFNWELWRGFSDWLLDRAKMVKRKR